MNPALSDTTPLGPAPGEVDRLLEGEIGMTPGVLGEVVRAALRAGGKRMRPRLVYLAASAGGTPDLEQCRRYAVAVEFLHTATLLHDDLVDGATLRRGEPAAHRRFGPKEAVLCGDLLLARCLGLVSGTGDPDAMACLARAAERLALGEAMEVELARQADISREVYLHYAASKTGALFAAAAGLGARAAGASPEARDALEAYGEALGLAFQMADDVLDVTMPTSTLGKAAAADLREGIPTLPVLEALAALAGRREARALADVIEGRRPGRAALAEARALVKEHGAEPARREALARADLARAHLDALPPSPATAALRTLAARAVERLS